MSTPVTARRDANLSARITHRTRLYYQSGGDPDGERLPYVRAGSSLTRCADRYAVVQDDANFLALIHPDEDNAHSFALPAGPEGHRMFDSEHDNKGDKLDLEACVTVPGQDADLLVLLGSGSAPHRERVIVVTLRDGAPTDAVVREVPALYAALREERAFSGSGLNVEGMVLLGDTVRLFQRGDAPPHDGLQPVNATCDLPWEELWAHFQDPDNTPPPEPSNVVQYELGELDGIRLGFSDAVVVGDGAILFSASAEDSSDGGDGRVAGSVLGVIDPSGDARLTTLTDRDGGMFRGKVEGLGVSADDPRRAYFVVDDDDPGQPSELFHVELSGPWYR